MATVVIVGGGVIGCAVAERLSRERRHRVILIERDSVGAHASGAAAGLLTPHSGSGPHEAAGAALRSFAMFPELVERVERSGVSVEFREQESITFALTESEERGLRAVSGRWLDADQTRAAEPALSPEVRGAALASEAQLTPIRLVRALALTAAAQGAEIRESTLVTGVVVHQGSVHAVQTAEGRVEADVVVLAAGPWSPFLASPLGVVVAVRPSRGQLVMLRPRDVVLRRILTWRTCYLVPKPDGTVVAGSTEEDVGFDPRPTAEGIGKLLEFAVHSVPSLGTATVERAWAALRPSPRDGEPVVGPVAEVPNLVLATGHDRSGILLAPITAQAVAAGIP